jgi:hypothetical protein
MEKTLSKSLKILFNLFLFGSFIVFLFVSPPHVFGAQVTVAWDANTEPDLKGYRVYYGTASRVYGAPFDVGKATSYTLVNLAPGQKYFIAVTAYNTANKESAFSNEVSATTAALEAVSPPSVLTGPTGGTTGGAYSYTAGGSSSSLGHPIEYQFDWKGDGTVLSSWGSASQSNTWTAAGTYQVRARARCATHTNVVSSWSNPLSVTIRLPGYPIVSMFSIASGASTTETRTVILNNVATNKPRYYMASESPNFAGARWKYYSQAPKFRLSPGAGTKTVYFKVKNNIGESPVVSDTIMLK